MSTLSLNVESPDFAATSEVLCVGPLTLVLLSFVSIGFSIARYGWRSQLHTRKRSSLTELIPLAGDKFVLTPSGSYDEPMHLSINVCSIRRPPPCSQEVGFLFGIFSPRSAVFHATGSPRVGCDSSSRKGGHSHMERLCDQPLSGHDLRFTWC